MDVENGVIKMEEILNLIIHQRNSWQTAEEELRKKHIASAAHSGTKCSALSQPEAE